MRRGMGLADVVLFYTATIVGLSTIAQVAQFGLGSITLYLVAVVTFLIPCAIMVAELGKRMPQEGGLYLWTRSAFGDTHGFICAWSYYVSNIVWLPTIAMLVSASVLYLFGSAAQSLADSTLYNATVSLAMLWALTALNILGIDRAKWVQNAGGLATIAILFVTLLLGGVFIGETGSLQQINARDFIPALDDTALLGFFALVALSFGGLELAPVLAGEIREPQKNLPRAILIASLLVGVIYIVLTLMLVLMSPGGDIDIIHGYAGALHSASEAMDLQELGALAVTLVVVSTLGVFGGWLTGTARIPFVIGIAHYLPPSFARVHPRYGSPYVSLLAQALMLSLFVVAAAAGSTVKEAFLILLDMSIILYFLPYLYLFAALLWHVRAGTGSAGLFPRLNRAGFTTWAVVSAGFLTTLSALLVSVIPTKDVENEGLFLLKVVGGASLLLLLGLGIYLHERRKPLPVEPRRRP